MPSLSYRQPGLVLGITNNHATARQIRDLQRDLRSLGYLRSGIDGQFGVMTETALRALQYDMLRNDGAGSDGSAPVKFASYNQERVNDVTGQADQKLVACISDMLDDPRFPKLPHVDNPVTENRKVVEEIAQMPPDTVPIPFLLAIFRQESDLQHYHEPQSGDADTFVIVGLDRNGRDRSAITSRGYGVGQYTLFHHPPTAQEVDTLIRGVSGNTRMATRTLKEKFDRFVNGPASKASDRQAEIGRGPLRTCKYQPEDPRFMRDCRHCLLAAGSTNIQTNVTPVYPGSSMVFRPTAYYSNASYRGVPLRRAVGCDWPYAARRYNGSGINSYHYQARILQHLVAGNF